MEKFPQVVVLHTRQNSDYTKVLHEAGLVAPLGIHSFTDTHPAVNDHNTSLSERIADCDVLIVEEQLMLAGSDAAQVAFGGMTKVRSSDRRVVMVNDSSEVVFDTVFAGLPEVEVR
jgi:hypothetical protein